MNHSKIIYFIMFYLFFIFQLLQAQRLSDCVSMFDPKSFDQVFVDGFFDQTYTVVASRDQVTAFKGRVFSNDLSKQEQVWSRKISEEIKAVKVSGYFQMVLIITQEIIYSVSLTNGNQLAILQVQLDAPQIQSGENSVVIYDNIIKVALGPVVLNLNRESLQLQESLKIDFECQTTVVCSWVEAGLCQGKFTIKGLADSEYKFFTKIQTQDYVKANFVKISGYYCFAAYQELSSLNFVRIKIDNYELIETPIRIQLKKPWSIVPGPPTITDDSVSVILQDDQEMVQYTAVIDFSSRNVSLKKISKVKNQGLFIYALFQSSRIAWIANNPRTPGFFEYSIEFEAHGYIYDQKERKIQPGEDERIFPHFYSHFESEEDFETYTQITLETFTTGFTHQTNGFITQNNPLSTSLLATGSLTPSSLETRHFSMPIPFPLKSTSSDPITLDFSTQIPMLRSNCYEFVSDSDYARNMMQYLAINITPVKLWGSSEEVLEYQTTIEDLQIKIERKNTVYGEWRVDVQVHLDRDFQVEEYVKESYNIQLCLQMPEIGEYTIVLEDEIKVMEVDISEYENANRQYCRLTYEIEDSMGLFDIDGLKFKIKEQENLLENVSEDYIMRLKASNGDYQNIKVRLLHPCHKFGEMSYEGPNMNYTLPSEGLKVYYKDIDCGQIQFDSILAVRPQEHYNDFIDQNLDTVLNALSISDNQIVLDLDSSLFGGFYFIDINITLQSYSNSFTFTQTIEIYHPCIHSQPSIPQEPSFFYSSLDHLPLTFTPFTSPCGTFNYSSSLLVGPSWKMLKMENLQAVLYIEDSIKDQIIQEFGQYSQTRLYIEFNATLQGGHKLYRREVKQRIWFQMGPCQVKRIIPGKFAQDLPVIYELMEEAVEMKVKMPGYTFEPAECEMENGIGIELLYTPFRQNRGDVPQHSVEEYFSLLVNRSFSFPTLPSFISFNNDTFTIDSSKTSDIGFYKIFIRAEIFNPGTGQLLFNDDLILELKATIPEHRLLNIPPFFVDFEGNAIYSLPQLEFQVEPPKFLQDQEFKYRLPETKDDKGREVSIEVELGQVPQAKYENQEIIIVNGPELKEKYEVNVRLSDGELQQSYELVINFKFIQEEMTQEEVSWVEIPLKDEKEDGQEEEAIQHALEESIKPEEEKLEPPYIFISSIDNFGTVIIDFSEPLLLSTSENIILEDILNFKVFGQNSSISNSTLIDKDPLTIQLTFQNPLLITKSGSTQIDELVVTVLDPSLFVSVETSLPIQETQLIFPIPGQIPLEDQDLLISASSTVENGMISILLGSFFLQILMSISLSKLFKITSQIQLVVYISLINLNLPGNSSFLLDTLKNLTDLSIIPEKQKQKFFRGQARMQDKNLVSKGYTSVNFFDNLGGFVLVLGGLMSLIFMIVILKMLLKIARRVFSKSPKMFFLTQKIEAKMQKQLLWTIIISSCINSYTKFALSCWISLKSSGFGDLSALFAFIFYLCFFPILIFLIVKNNKQDIPSLRQLFVDLKPSFSGLLYNFFFCLRRLLFTFILIWIPSSSLQILSIICLTHLNLAYLISSRPQIRPQLQLVNEILFMGMTYQLLLFTEFAETSGYTQGWLQISLILTIVVINLSYLVVSDTLSFINKKQRKINETEYMQKIRQKIKNVSQRQKINEKISQYQQKVKIQKQQKKNREIGEKKLKEWDEEFMKGEYKRGVKQKAFQGNFQYFRIKKLCKLPIIYENVEKFDLNMLVLKQESSDSDQNIREIIDLRKKVSPEEFIQMKPKYRFTKK